MFLGYQLNFEDMNPLSIVGGKRGELAPFTTYVYPNAIINYEMYYDVPSLPQITPHPTSYNRADGVKHDKCGNIWEFIHNTQSTNVYPDSVMFRGNRLCGGNNFSDYDVLRITFMIIDNTSTGRDRPGTITYAWYRSQFYSGTPDSIDYQKFLNSIRDNPNRQLLFFNLETSAISLYTGSIDYLSSGSAYGWQYFTSEGISPILPPDPYAPGGIAGAGGGDGTFDGTSDDIDIPSLPGLSAADTGFITLFNPTLAELRNLAEYMWSPLFSLDTFKKLFADPMNAILGLSIVPVAVPNGGSRNVTVGNISTGITMTVAAHQYVEVDCGTLNVEEYWGAYLDYDPYTKCYIYLPYIGTHPISTDDVMGKSVHIVYHVDILSGACTAFIKCGGSVMYQFIGQVASSIPITGDNFTNVINGVLNIAGSIGTMVATGGFSAPASVAKAGLATAYKAGHNISAGASMAQNVMDMKPQVEKSAALSGTGGMLSIQVPYMILERPNQAIPENQNTFMGYPSYITDRLGDLSGYTEVEHIHLDNIPCTELEADEILEYLEKGVIL